jgi:hypothetical protein
VAGAATDEVYAAMDWLHGRQDAIEKQLATTSGPHGEPVADRDVRPVQLVGDRAVHCELAARGYSRDGKKGCQQIEYGLLTDPAGRPVAIRVFAGNTADPTAFTAASPPSKTPSGWTNMVMVGDRGMITSARITCSQSLGGLGWLTALRAPPSPLWPPTGPCR